MALTKAGAVSRMVLTKGVIFLFFFKYNYAPIFALIQRASMNVVAKFPRGVNMNENTNLYPPSTSTVEFPNILNISDSEVSPFEKKREKNELTFHNQPETCPTPYTTALKQ